VRDDIAQMVAATTQVKQVLGQQDSISDKQIRDSLWDSYFDVEGTISYLLDELHKQESKKKRKEEQGKELSQTTPQLEDSQQGETRVKMERLSLQPTPSDTTSLPPPTKLSKLSTKVSLAKSTPSSASEDPPISSSNGDVAPPSTKPLSKLQQKMLLAKQQKSQSSSQSSSNPLSTPTPSETAPPPPTPIDDTIMVTLPASFEPSPFLVAPPSPFASALKPHLKRELKAGKELAEHLAKSSPIELAMGGKRERWGLSPDDKVLEARKGTALGKESVKRK